ncbi:MAG: hypothetical protein EHM45_02880 [Desulfobacteraceae bacterium]|nr:MAG: hypothetical protein EHM45_02880 [Desulfobacteraceae bacterium]
MTLKKLINSVLEKRVSWISQEKARKIRKQVSLLPIDPVLAERYRKKWSRLGTIPKKTYLEIFASIFNSANEDFVPEDLYYNRVEPVLNRKSFALAYADKNFYERYLSEYRHLFPVTWLRGINGSLFDASFAALPDAGPVLRTMSVDSEYILKPASETSGGRKVNKVRKCSRRFRINEMDLSLEEMSGYLREQYQNNFVLQDKISSHPFFSAFNPDSLNTVRIFTYRSIRDELVHPLQAVLRFGRPGNLVDNQAAGGRTYGISTSGSLNRFAIDKWGRRYEAEANHKEMMAFPVPGLTQMKQIAADIAEKYLFHRLLGFDFCYSDKNEVKLLEINCKNIEINFLQMNNGPLFGSFTDEVIEYCSKNKKVVALDFEI